MRRAGLRAAPDAERSAPEAAFAGAYGHARGSGAAPRGVGRPRPPWPPPSVGELVGLGWLHALHARSSIERGQLWQAEYMVSGVRDQVLALACLRHGLPAAYARGADRLPPDAVAGLDAGLVRA